ncbi:DUF2334 domain-containing protein [Streptomyces orinoci]|uniref:Polysaccharide deacetylase family protein n=1 Tax=Streptomyces orinoci TaxID=67339 RepID=A0ABV3JV89_STRON|nr:polysaccharide deacetylase family protein [Streptomyces orinoci]
MRHGSGSAFVVSVHDVASWSLEQSRHWVGELDARAVPATLLLVPGPWRGPGPAGDPALAGWVREAARRGHETALHGWTHQAVPGGPPARRLLNAVLARGCAEFCALDERSARTRLERGLTTLGSMGLAPCGFTPPGWLASRGTLAALRALGLEYTTSHLAVLDLRTATAHRMPALSHRPGGLGERAGARLLTAAVRRWSARGTPFRIALHPDDLARPGLRECALRAVDTALEAGARPYTYAELVRARRAEAGGRR